MGPETGTKPIHQGQGTGNNEEVSRAGLGRGVAEPELFSQNSLFLWLGHSAGLRWGLKEAGTNQKARTQIMALHAEGSAMLTIGQFL